MWQRIPRMGGPFISLSTQAWGVPQHNYGVVNIKHFRGFAKNWNTHWSEHISFVLRITHLETIGLNLQHSFAELRTDIYKVWKQNWIYNLQVKWIGSLRNNEKVSVIIRRRTLFTTKFTVPFLSNFLLSVCSAFAW